MRCLVLVALIMSAGLAGAPALAQQAAPEVLARAVQQAWPTPSPAMQARIDQDVSLSQCSLHRNQPPPALAAQIEARESATVRQPPDGIYMGNWQRGLAGALSGYGLRMGDDPRRANGGNCFACHQLTPTELSYGTLGPSLLAYGRTVGDDAATQRRVYEKIYNAQAVMACSLMPRFGSNEVLPIEAIKDYVALLLDPLSPVNQPVPAR